jgi:Fe-S-cluster-containing hydrogenase component 2
MEAVSVPVAVREAHCPQNHRCPALRACPTGALTQQGFAAPTIDATKCTECGKCVRVCPMGALHKS